MFHKHFGIFIISDRDNGNLLVFNMYSRKWAKGQVSAQTFRYSLVAAHFVSWYEKIRTRQKENQFKPNKATMHSQQSSLYTLLKTGCMNACHMNACCMNVCSLKTWHTSACCINACYMNPRMNAAQTRASHKCMLDTAYWRKSWLIDTCHMNTWCKSYTAQNHTTQKPSTWMH
jgi:hypothetical protein